ncbi:MAG: hypothetical protein LC540_19690 [Candidatus Thiodiazotropha sp.]|nr:hypothetical protein [Candidatus Thiodiazotropha sp.]
MASGTLLETGDKEAVEILAPPATKPRQGHGRLGSQRGVGLIIPRGGFSNAPVCEVEIEDQQEPVTVRRRLPPVSYLSEEVKLMVSRNRERKLSTQLCDEAEDDDAFDEADLSAASDDGDKDYVPDADARELLSGEEEENDDDDKEESTMARGPLLTCFRGRVARTRKENGVQSDSRKKCVVPGCRFVGANLKRHLRGAPHNFSDQQVEAVIRIGRLAAGLKVKGEKVAITGRPVIPCPLIGEAYVDKPTLKCKTKATQRLDTHLVSKHGLDRQSEAFKRAYARAESQTLAQKRQTDIQISFDEIVKKYTDVNEGRSMGKKQTPSTSVAHRSALKLLLPDISLEGVCVCVMGFYGPSRIFHRYRAGQSWWRTPECREKTIDLPQAVKASSHMSLEGIHSLMSAGDKNGRIDTLVSGKQIKPRTLQVYFASICKFLFWLSQDQEVLDRLQIKADLVIQCRTKLKLFSESLNADVAKSDVDSAVECAVEGESLAPWMEAGFQDSEVVKDAIRLAEEASFRQLKGTEMCTVRNTLYLELTLDQIRTAGDVNCIFHNRAMAVLDQWHMDGCPDDETYQIQVKGAKNYQFGARTIINITPPIFVLFRLYLLHVRKQFKHAGTCERLIVSRRRKDMLSGSGLSKAYQGPWEQYGKEIGIVLPKITASKNRSLNATLHRETGAT